MNIANMAKRIVITRTKKRKGKYIFLFYLFIIFKKIMVLQEQLCKNFAKNIQSRSNIIRTSDILACTFARSPTFRDAFSRRISKRPFRGVIKCN